MIDKKTLGKRIRFFRKRAKLSQFELENQLDASSGMISRIESGKVNPTKETVRGIAKILKMNNRELDYLIGATSQPASQKEIRKAKEQVKDYFDKTSTFAYLLDERWRLHAYSKGMEKMISSLRAHKEIPIRALEKSMIEITCNKNIGLETKFFPDNYYKTQFLKFQLSRYWEEVAFMYDDESVQSTLEVINNDPHMTDIWEMVQHNQMNTNSIEAKTTYVKILGMEVKLNYSREPLPSIPRFETIELFPTNKLLRLLRKLI